MSVPIPSVDPNANQRLQATNDSRFEPRFVDRFYHWRNGLVSNPKFQRWAAWFPLTRWISARESRKLFDLTAGFVYSQILAACVELDIFRIVEPEPLTAEQLSHRLSLSVEATERLIRAATALSLLEKRGYSERPSRQQRYGLGMSGAALLGNPGAVGMIKHHHLLYEDLADPVGLLRDSSKTENPKLTALTQFWPYARMADDGEKLGDAKPSSTSPYSALMSVSQSLVVDDILECYPFEKHQRVMDVGGGEGTFLMSLAEAHSKLHLTLFDLPAVAAKAEQRFRDAKLAARAVAVGGNAATDSLPEGADLITLIRVLHDHNDERAKSILKAIHKALPPGGHLLIAEPMADARGAERMGDAYFGFYLLAMGSGRPRSAKEIVTFLGDAGFDDIRIRKTRRPLLTGAISARKSQVSQQ
jgi:demethylspheroidene O-methyltransferase